MSQALVWATAIQPASNVLDALMIFESLLYCPQMDPVSEVDSGRPLLLEKHLCRRLYRSKDVMSGLATFLVRHAASSPSTDLEWLASRFSSIFTALCLSEAHTFFEWAVSTDPSARNR